MSDLWATRRQAEVALQGSLRPEAAIVDRGFELVDMCAEALAGVDTPFSRVCTGVLVKGRNLALACYSVALDGLAQEGGALLRPLVEAAQLLLYFAPDQKRVDRMLADKKLPKAGDIAQELDSPCTDLLHRLRDYLNAHASHFSFTDESIRHMGSVQAGQWRLTQPHNDAVLRTNLAMLYAAQYLLIEGAAQCLALIGAIDARLIDELVDEVEQWWRRGSSVFAPASGSDSATES